MILTVHQPTSSPPPFHFTPSKWFDMNTLPPVGVLKGAKKNLKVMYSEIKPAEVRFIRKVFIN